MKLEKTYTVNAPIEKVLEGIRDPAMIEANEKSRDALEVKIEDVQRDDSKHCYRVATTNHFRTKTGGEDKSKTELNTITNEWDLNTKSCTWSWEGNNPNTAKVKLSGTTALKASGDKTEMTQSVDAEINIPLIGKTISKKVAAEFEKEWPKYVTQLEKFLGS